MANYKEHLTTGALVGALSGLALNIATQLNRINNNPEEKFDWIELSLWVGGGGAIGAFAGVLPDILEPASNPNHRKTFHSISASLALGYGVYKANSSELTEEAKTSINIAAVGYLSHLFLDSKTPMGLPII